MPLLQKSNRSNLYYSLCICLFLSLGFNLNLKSSAQNYSVDVLPVIEGTEVQIFSENFLAVVTTGQILEGRLELYNSLTPTQKVQVIFSNAQTGEVAILPAIVSFEGNDLLIPTSRNTVTNNLESSEIAYISLYDWLLSNKGITITVPIQN